jgi:4-amino-4-deoxy-L-arabinose transferase-like glycosyltransferase
MTQLLLPPPGAVADPAPQSTPRRRIDPSALLVAGLLALTVAVRLVNLTGAPERIDDEGTYVAQAYALTRFGELAHYTYWYDHPPLGWMQIALWFLATGGPGDAPNAVASGRAFMVVLSAAAVVLTWVLGRRLGLSRAAAASAGMVFALSPLAVQLGRTVYLDNIAVVWLLAGLVLLCSPQRRLSAVFGAATCIGIAVLTKETVLLALPGVVWLAWTRSGPATRRYTLAVLGTVLGLVVTGYVLFAAVRNELIPGPGHVSLLDGIGFQLWQRQAGGSVFDPASANRVTVDRWFALDPVLLTAALPATVLGLAVRQVRAIAVVVVMMAAVLLRDGYLPIPFVIAALPLVALLTAGVLDAAVSYRRPGHAGLRGRPFAAPAVAAALVAGVVAATSWTPTLRYLTTEDSDAPMQQAQSWIAQNVPRTDRLIVDDALWVDLVADGRDRRDVVWSYKVDTDSAVRAWSPDGWRDYDWVVSTPSLRSTVPATGDLASAVAAGTPVAVFGSGDGRVEILRVDPAGDAAGSAPVAPDAGTALAGRLADTADPAALAVLRTGRTDPRVLATLATLAATEPVLLTGLPAVAGEDPAGTPRRQVLLAAAGARADRAAAFFRAQTGSYAAESVQRTADGLLVRFPLPVPAGVLPAAAVPGGSPARLRVLDLRAGAGAERVDLVSVDGRAVGSVPTAGYGDPTGYRTVAPGAYLLTTHDPSQPAAPVLRQPVRITAGGSYTVALFTGPSGGAEVTTEVVPDTAPDEPRGLGAVQLVEAARDAGKVKITVAGPQSPTGTVLADGVEYGLVTGYAQVPSGSLTAVVDSGGKQTRSAIRVPSGGAATLVLVDTPDGAELRSVPIDTRDPTSLDPPTLAVVTAAGTAAAGTGAVGVAAVPAPDGPRWSALLLALGVALGAGATVAAGRLRRAR